MKLLLCRAFAERAMCAGSAACAGGGDGARRQRAVTAAAGHDAAAPAGAGRALNKPDYTEQHMLGHEIRHVICDSFGDTLLYQQAPHVQEMPAVSICCRNNSRGRQTHFCVPVCTFCGLH